MDTGLTPEQLGYVETATEAISGVGATALSNEVQAPDAEANQGGFLRRAGTWVKNSLKQTWNEHPAVKAVTEAGGSFSKWDTAKVVGRVLFVDTPIVAAQGMTGQIDAMNNRAALSRSGATSDTMRRKMAGGLIDGPYSNNPVRQHLSRSDVPQSAAYAVENTGQRIRQERHDPVSAEKNKIMKRAMGGMVVGLAAPLIAKGLIDAQTVELARDVVTFK